MSDSSGTASSLRYTPLTLPSSTRILHLYSAKDSSLPLECKLEEIDLRKPPKYYAVSYVWGDKTGVPPTISCDGAVLPITRNLDDALRKFRREDDEISLWTDSVCIDQNNIPERNAQVRLMGDIYSTASEVLIWLGRENEFEDTTAALRMIDALRCCVTPRFSELQAIENLGQFSNVEEEFGIPDVRSQEFRALSGFLNRPWFSRAWTFQESILARKRKFYIGDRTISSQVLEDAQWALFALWNCTNVPEFHEGFNQQRAILLYEKDDKDDKHEIFTLLNLLWIRRGSGHTNPVDLIYSLLGTAHDNVPIDVDYSKPMEIVYAETALNLIQHSGNLAVLSRLHGNRQQVVGIPSWVPDWRDACSQNKFLMEPILTHLFSAAGSSKPRHHLSNDKMELTLEGIIVDKIVGTMEWSRVDHTHMSDDEWIRLLSADHNQSGNSEGLPVRLPKRKFTLDDTQLSGSTKLPSKDACIDLILQGANHTRYMWTETGKIGHVDCIMEAGDIIVILLGGQVPFVLKPQATGKYILLSQCYVQDYMDGYGLVEARIQTDPGYDGRDISWLKRLDKDAIPFSTQKFTLI